MSTTLVDAIVRSAMWRLDLALVAGEESFAIHAATCGTSTTHPGRCHVGCDCWCHGPDDGRTS